MSLVKKYKFEGSEKQKKQKSKKRWWRYLMISTRRKEKSLIARSPHPAPLISHKDFSSSTEMLNSARTLYPTSTDALSKKAAAMRAATSLIQSPRLDHFLTSSSGQMRSRQEMLSFRLQL